MAANLDPNGRIQLGVIGRAHGVRGLVKVTSHTADPADLTAYGPLSDLDGRHYVLRWKGEGIAAVARMVDGVAVPVSGRSQAEKLTNTRLFIDRSALPPPQADEYYVTDLINLAAIDTAGRSIGTVSAVHDYGAGASLEVVGAGESRLIPFTAACVPVVDIAARRLIIAPPNEMVVQPDAEAIVGSDAEVIDPPDARATFQAQGQDSARLAAEDVA